MKYRPEIDGLRALAVVPVILFHAGFPYFTGGYVGVDIFFVISGYLITTILINELSEGRFSILNFYDRRTRRIMPSLFVVIIASFIAGWFILLPEDFERFSLSAVAATTFWSNIFFWMESGYFDTETELKPLLHTWSLAVEEQYYIFFPVLLALFWRFGKAVILSILAVIFAASLALGIWDFGALSEPEAAFYLLPTRAWELMIGSFVAFYMARAAPRLPAPALSGLLSVMGMALILYAIFAYDKNTPFPSLYTLAPTLGTALIILFERRGTWSFYVLANPVCIGIGLVSYSAYLWHQPLFAYARYLSLDHPPLTVMGVLSLATFGLAWLSYKFVETPFRNKTRFTRRRIFAGAGAVGALIIALGFAGLLSKGVPSRYDARHLAVFQQYDDPGRYVRTRFLKLLNAEFDASDPRAKLLIIGDSYGQDMVNAVKETALDTRYQMSTFRISSRCGNIFLKRDFTDLIAPADHALCAKRPGSEDAGLQERIKQADDIWLVSSWKDWHVENLPESLTNIKAITTAKIRVMGRKHFGSGMSLKRYMAEYQKGNSEIEMPLNSGHRRINALMQKLLIPEDFIDISEMMCGAGETCKNMTPEGLLISYDGGHLTRAGATLMGERLSEHLKAVK